MIDEESSLKPCESGEFRFMAEFKWDWKSDGEALQQFGHWKPDSQDPDGLFPPGSHIDKKKTQGFYLNGTRTFWIISCAKKWEHVAEFCYRVVGGTHLTCDFWECKDPQPQD